jgi:RNA polymerase sigma-70 factor (ECF subfamily)
VAFTEIDEKLLVRAYQAGDERAFDTIVRTQYQALYAHALKRLMQHEAAEDAVQDTMLRAYRALPNLDGDLALRAWLHRILTNVCHDEGNRRRRHHGLVEKVAALPEEHAPDPIDDTLLHETVQVMAKALEELPESYREALVLRYVDGLSFREVGEATGVSEENARARVHRGRQALHKVLTRVSVMMAFIIPGLRRATAAGGDAPVTPAPDGVNLATQLTSHVVQAGPTMSRLAEMASTVGGKTALVTGAVAAVAAVAAPVVVHDEGSKKTPSALAAPAPSSSSTTVGPTVALDPTTTTALVTTTSIPASLATPFAGLAKKVAAVTPTSTTSTTQPGTTPTTAPPPADASIDGTTITASGDAPQWDVSGQLTLNTKSQSVTGALSGRIYVYDDGSASSNDLTLTLNGSTVVVKFRGNVTSQSSDASGTTYLIYGTYALTGGDQFGLAGHGSVTVGFHPDGQQSTLSVALRSGS